MVSLTNGVPTFLLLLFAFHLRKGACKYLDLNCQFNYRGYNLKTERVRFGEEPEGVAGNIQTYFYRIKKIYTQFMMGGLTYNGVDNYIRFYKYYKTVGSKFKKEPFQTVLRDYNVIIDSDEETAGNIVTLMELIASKVPSLAEASYLVTASPDFEDVLANKLNSPEDYKHWSYVNVAGVIKINDKSSGRVGYVLLDPKRFEHPQVVMEDGGKTPFKFLSFVPYGHFRNAKAHILWFNSNDHNRTASNFIYGNGLGYYFKRPFCSFVEHTVKLHLVNLKRTLIKYVDAGFRSTAFVAESLKGGSVGNLVAFFFVNGDINNKTMLIPTPEGSKELEDLSARINCLCTNLVPTQNLNSCQDKMQSRIKDLIEISNDELFVRDSGKYFEENSKPPAYMLPPFFFPDRSI